MRHIIILFFLSALTKGVGLRSDGRIDDRSFWINHVSSLSTPLAIPLICPRMISVHDLDTKVWMELYIFDAQVLWIYSFPMIFLKYIRMMKKL